MVTRAFFFGYTFILLRSYRERSRWPPGRPRSGLEVVIFSSSSSFGKSESTSAPAGRSLSLKRFRSVPFAILFIVKLDGFCNLVSLVSGFSAVSYFGVASFPWLSVSWERRTSLPALCRLETSSFECTYSSWRDYIAAPSPTCNCGVGEIRILPGSVMF